MKNSPGQPKKFNEETRTIPFVCPKSKVTEFKELVYKILDKWKIKK